MEYSGIYRRTALFVLNMLFLFQPFNEPMACNVTIYTQATV